eukprot:Plantae.Rhodophyta-Rhodochaete_pulchella.ctg15573.p1 GENE.Plantae.Rhodophyta-Rhodochaete_pulchella.ctg15573~~Plantae.Rhodophyta-Rhodochaete_pulchella.ctg15573.p1  ORF type:complete len:183 (-),score=8.19 Plantae.Rhodophyta-Rhodochaete_pulchella.ctg15573:340-888(-)
MRTTVELDAKIVPDKSHAWKLLGPTRGRRTRCLTLPDMVLTTMVFAGVRLRESWRSNHASRTKRSPRRSASFPIKDDQHDLGQAAAEACSKVYIDLGAISATRSPSSRKVTFKEVDAAFNKTLVSPSTRSASAHMAVKATRSGPTRSARRRRVPIADFSSSRFSKRQSSTGATGARRSISTL